MKNYNGISLETINPNINNESTYEDSVLLNEPTVTQQQSLMDDTSETCLNQNQNQNQNQNPMQPLPLPFQSRLQSYPLAITKVDDDLLHRAIADAGRWAFGTICKCLFLCVRVRVLERLGSQSINTHPQI